MGRAMQNLYLDMCRQRWWPRSAFIKQKSHLKDAQNVKIRSSCTGTKYHPGLCSPFIHSEVSNDTIIGGQWRKAPIRLCRLICVFAVHIILKTSFHMVRLILSLKVLYTIIADDILISVFFYLSEKIRFDSSCELTIHMKCQVWFSH